MNDKPKHTIVLTWYATNTDMYGYWTIGWSTGASLAAPNALEPLDPSRIYDIHRLSVWNNIWNGRDSSCLEQRIPSCCDDIING